ncbi:hypothetical protein X848_gp35 [Edwardsiella phage PEi21]|uniref:Uncharacterized protein n=1 Tax=Edwardsiella phage PEi21 TaxID=1325372 RepID=N0DPD7_9CAUD|nr:hypothetical protein X848_gp35 [Edwardsiella phage PEi21]QXV72956.1 hypothetical protein [Edwardsiella phage PVN06]BAN16845.1 hypothetical protein [Edwardsiella phage PEi21]
MLIHIVAKHLINHGMSGAYARKSFEIVSIHKSRKEAQAICDGKNENQKYSVGGCYYYDVVTKRIDWLGGSDK